MLVVHYALSLQRILEGTLFGGLNLVVCKLNNVD